MGNEATCEVSVDGKRAEARALLETDEVVVRGALKAKLPFRDLVGVEVKGDALVLRTKERTVEISLGSREAERWAGKIRNPKGRLDKLGVKHGMRVSVMGTIDDDDFTAELASRGVELCVGEPLAESDVIFFGVTRSRELARLPRLKTSLQPKGAIWVVRPKGTTEVTEAQVMASAKSAGLVDVKVVRFSDTLTAEKVVIPVAAR